MCRRLAAVRPLLPARAGVDGVIAVAVTGGIGSGKSTVSAILGRRGAVVVDSDRLAREVVALGTPGLAAVLERFGPSVRAADGGLDRPALAAVVFADPAARADLEGITHPLVRARFTAIRDAAPPGAVVVNDIPLLTTLPAAAAFQLVVGVGAPLAARLDRLVRRGLTEGDAKARVAAQLDDAERAALCDLWLDNGGNLTDLERSVGLLWSERLRPFAANVAAGRPAPRTGPGSDANARPSPALVALVAARISAAAEGRPAVEAGALAVTGPPAADGRSAAAALQLQLTVEHAARAAALIAPLGAAGFPAVERARPTPPRGLEPSADAGTGRRWLHANADPGQVVDLVVRLSADGPDDGGDDGGDDAAEPTAPTLTAG